MTIKQQYKKARANYLARVNRLKKQGWDITPISIVKKPTKASIERLNKQTAKVLRDKHKLINLVTGKVVTKHRLKIAKEQGKQYKQRRNQSISSGIAKQVQRDDLWNDVTSQFTAQEMEEIPVWASRAIDDWMQELNEYFANTIREILFNWTEKLTDTEEKANAFTWVLENHHDEFPQVPYEPSSILNDRFRKIERLMNEHINSKKAKEQVSKAFQETDEQLLEIIDGADYERYWH